MQSCGAIWCVCWIWNEHFIICPEVLKYKYFIFQSSWFILILLMFWLFALDLRCQENIILYRNRQLLFYLLTHVNSYSPSNTSLSLRRWINKNQLSLFVVVSESNDQYHTNTGTFTLLTSEIWAHEAKTVSADWTSAAGPERVHPHLHSVTDSSNITVLLTCLTLLCQQTEGINTQTRGTVGSGAPRVSSCLHGCVLKRTGESPEPLSVSQTSELKSQTFYFANQ